MTNPKRHKKELFYQKAKKEGYRARSAYKLLDIQKKYNLFKRAFYILDIGSAPGSWLQVAKEIAENNIEKYDDSHYHRNHYKILGVDLKHITPIEGVSIIKNDVTTEDFGEKVKEFFTNEKADLILSDASIKKSGNQYSDQILQTKLCYKILSLVNSHLKINGNFVIKCFQGVDFQKFYKDVKKRFKFVKAYKPASSKKKSNEMYIVCIKKK
jgi:23S rRNA (uridine2552-2'-O)-methyltransferase